MMLPSGSIGVHLSAPAIPSAALLRRTVTTIEDIGYSAVWMGEAEGREALSQAAIVLAVTTRLIAATGIASIWARDPVAMANGGRGLAEAWPGRFILGVGVSHRPHTERRGHVYSTPVRALDAYLSAMDLAPYIGELPAMPVPVVLSALGPKMLQLAADRSCGAYSFFVPTEHTRQARLSLGRDRFLAAAHAVVIAPSIRAARELSASYMRSFLQLNNYRRNLRRLGWSADDVEGAGSDDLFDHIVAWGDPKRIAARVREHLSAGADHLVVNVVGSSHSDDTLDTLRRLGPELL
jgi:probable F420-dependent oxidoreductase